MTMSMAAQPGGKAILKPPRIYQLRPAYVANKVALNSSSDNLTYSFDYGNSIFIGLDVPGDIDYL